MVKDLFNPSHGLHQNEGIDLVHMAPMTMGEPHAHIPHWEEVWVKLPPTDSYSYMMLGSEVREMPANSAFLAPPNNRTVHSVFNLSKDNIEAWLYIGYTVKHTDRLSEPTARPKSLSRRE
jgi:hypothetical protein